MTRALPVCHPVLHSRGNILYLVKTKIPQGDMALTWISSFHQSVNEFDKYR